MAIQGQRFSQRIRIMALRVVLKKLKFRRSGLAIRRLKKTPLKKSAAAPIQEKECSKKSEA
jgi:hypothetical protein